MRYPAIGLTLGISIAVSCGCAAPPSPAAPVNPANASVYGAEPASDAEQIEFAKALPMSVLIDQPTIPARFRIPSTALPIPQPQGTQKSPGAPGSCEIWSAGYALGSYTANLTNQQDLWDLDNTVSPAFLYMWVLRKNKRTCGVGSNPADSLNYLVTSTPPTYAEVPYQPYCSQYLDGIDTQKTYRTNLSIGSWSLLPGPKDPPLVLQTIKGYVAAGRVAQFSLMVPYGFDTYDPAANGGVFNVPATCPPGASDCYQHGAFACVGDSKSATRCGQHGMVVVGYDDTMPNLATGQPGAVVLMNSFGLGWGQLGLMSMSYASFEQLYFTGAVAEPPPAKGASPGVRQAFQRSDPSLSRGSAGSRTHLVFQVGLDAPMTSSTITFTGPDGKSLTQQLAQPFRSGYLYATRTDGQSFLAGVYTIRLQGTGSSGKPMDVVFRHQLAAGSTGLPSAAPFGAGMTGTTGRLTTSR